MDTKSRRKYKDFKDLLETIRSCGIKFNESKKKRDARLARLTKDYSKFVNYYFANGITIKRGTVSWFQKKAVDEIVKDGLYLGVHQWARGFAKSTTFSEFLPIFLMVKKLVHFVVIVGQDLESAHKKVMNIRHHLLKNRRLVQDFGPFFEVPSVAQGFFTTQHGVSFLGMGRKQSPRGLNVQGRRPDMVILDDVDDDDLCMSEYRVDTLHKKLGAAFYMTRGQGDMRFIVVGNKISYNSIVQKFEDNESFTVSKINALNEKGESNWPEVYSTERIKKDIKTIGRIAASTEMFNTPLIDGNIFKNAWLKFDDVCTFENVVCYYDPSWTSGSKSDYKSIITLGYNKATKKYIIFDIFCRKTTIDTLVLYFSNVLHNDLLKGYRRKYYHEANASQFFLVKVFEDTLKRFNLPPLPLTLDRRKKPSKHARIENLAPYFERGDILLHDRVKNTDDYTQFQSQLLSFSRGSRTPDDGPDALEGAFYQLKELVRTSDNFGITLGNQIKNFYQYFQ